MSQKTNGQAERLVDLEDVVGDVSSDSDSEGSSVSSWPWRRRRVKNGGMSP